MKKVAIIMGSDSDLPVVEKGIDILKSFKEVVKHIEAFIESNKDSNLELKEARDYLYNAMQSLKRESKKFEESTIDLASHYSE